MTTPITTQERISKNQSMASTYHISCKQSHATHFPYSDRPNTSVLLSYAHLSLPKEQPKWNQSATTWRHSSHRYSFSKESRFKDHSSYHSDILKPEIPTTLTTRSCTFGRGAKTPISTVILRNAKEKPGPDRYDMKIVD